MNDDDLSKLTNQKLQKILKSLGLSVKGKKSELVARIVKHEQLKPSEEHEPSEEQGSIEQAEVAGVQAPLETVQEPIHQVAVQGLFEMNPCSLCFEVSREYGKATIYHLALVLLANDGGAWFPLQISVPLGATKDNRGICEGCFRKNEQLYQSKIASLSGTPLKSPFLSKVRQDFQPSSPVLATIDLNTKFSGLPESSTPSLNDRLISASKSRVSKRPYPTHPGEDVNSMIRNFPVCTPMKRSLLNDEKDPKGKKRRFLNSPLYSATLVKTSTSTKGRSK